MSKGAVEVQSLTVELGAAPALLSVNLTLPPGGRLAVIGHSGAGKTTLLRALAGLVAPSGGTISLAGREVSRGQRVTVPPEQRKVGLVFQSLALWPHMSVERTLAYVTVGESPRDLAQRVGLEARLASYPEELSGGEQQRLAFIRALAAEPEVLLLDEPFAHLDAPLRESLGASLLELLAERGTTLIVATHQREVAFQLAEELLVLDHGAVRDAGTIDEVALHPRSATAVRLLGLGSVVEGELSAGTLKTPLGDLELEGEGGDPCALLRPEQLSVSAGEGDVRGSVVACEVFRPDATAGRFAVDVEVGGQRVRALSDIRHAAGAEVAVRVSGVCRRVSRT